MKKITTNPLLMLLALCFYVLSSCNKSDVQDQLKNTDEDEIEMEDVAKPGHHNPHNNCCCCPTAVATATNISYYLDFLSDPLQVGINVDVYYTNPGPQGTFRVVLRTASGDIDSVSVVPSNHTAAGQGGTFNLQYWVPYGSFPCTLQVNGRPSNLRCDIRTRKTFVIDNDINRK